MSAKKSKKKILICGGSGFIGSNFLRYFYESHPEYQLFNLDALTYSGNTKNLSDIEAKESKFKPADRRYIFLHGDICNTKFLDSVFEEYKFDGVINFAAESHVDRSLCSSYDFIRTNVLGAHALIEACRRFRTPRFLQISTDEVYGDVPQGFSTESSPLNPSNPYAASKASADHLIASYMRSHKLPAVIARGSNNVGPYQYPEKLIPLAISNFLEGKKIPVHGAGGQIRSWIFVLDFCSAIDLVFHKGKENHVYNASGTTKTNLEVLEAIKKCLKLSGDLSAYKVHVKDRPGGDARYAPDSSKIKRELGWSPKYSFASAIQETVNWYLKNRDWWSEIKTRPAFVEHYEKQREARYY